eukprot:77538_1
MLLFLFILVNLMAFSEATGIRRQSSRHRGGKSTKQIDFEGKLTHGKIQDYPIESDLAWKDTHLGKGKVKQCKKKIKRTNQWLVVCGRCPCEQTFDNRKRYN